METMMVKYRKGDHVKDVYGRGKGIVEKINIDYHEPFYILDNGVFWESELKIDEDYYEMRDDKLKQLLDEI